MRAESVWLDSDGKSAASYRVDSLGTPRSPVTPLVGGAAQAFQRFGDGSATIYYLRFTVNAADDVEAQERLANAYPDVSVIYPGEHRPIGSDKSITRLDVVAVGSAESATLSSGEVVVEATATSTPADYGTAMVTWTFDAEDKVKSLQLNASDRQSNDLTLHVDAYSHA